MHDGASGRDRHRRSTERASDLERGACGMCGLIGRHALSDENGEARAIGEADHLRPVAACDHRQLGVLLGVDVGLVGRERRRVLR